MRSLPLNPVAPLVAALAFFAAGCGSDSNELNLPAWEAQLASQFHLSPALVVANSNAATAQVTICHYPPGNRANAHTITVGAAAVPAHFRNHGDTIGPCGSAGGSAPGAGAEDGGMSGGCPGMGGTGGAGPGAPGSSSGGTSGSAPTSCSNAGGACASATDCCSSLVCENSYAYACSAGDVGCTCVATVN